MMKKLLKGQMLVELLLVIGLSAIIFPALLTGFIASREAKPQQKQRMQAITLVKEAEQAARSVRDVDWTLFATFSATPLHPVISSGKWELVPGAETINGMTRQIVINNVYRNVSGTIVPFSTPDASNDPSTKQVTVTMSWTKPYASSLNSAFYLTRSQNISSLADFNGEIFNHTQRASPSANIILENNQKGKWCSPSFAKDNFGNEVTIDLPDGPPVAVAANSAATVSIPNDVFVATAPNTTSSIKLAYLNVTANTDPPIPSLRGIFTLDAGRYSNASYIPTGIGLDNNFKTNDVQYYKSSSGKVYALMATNLPDREVIAIQINDGSGDAYQDPVNNIYKYWTFFNTKIYANAPPINQNNDTGFLNPSANAPETSGSGDNNGFQTNPTLAYVKDSNYAADSNSGTTTSTTYTDAGKDRHRFSNYNISLPSGTTVNGIEVQLDARVGSSCTSSPNTRKMYVDLSWNGGGSWTAAQSTSNLSTSSMTTYNLGGSANTWGRSWSIADFDNANFRLRITNVANSTTCEFRLDSAAVKVDYSDTVDSNDQAPFGYGGTTLKVFENKGYVASGGYLYVFDLSNIDSKTSSNGLDIVGCRVEIDGYDCQPGSGTDRKYSAGEVGTTWSSTAGAAHSDCSDGGNVELYADNDIYPVKVGSNTYIYVAVGAGTNPEFDITNVSSIPTSGTTPSISNNSCGRITGGNAGWKTISSLDFNSKSNTEEAANSVYAKSDGTRAYISSNGGIDSNGDGLPDSKQFYVLDTTDKNNPHFLSGTPNSPSYGPLTGFYYGAPPNDDLFPKRSLTVLNGERVVLVGKDGIANSKNAEEYQVLNLTNEANPTYCGGINFDQGFNDLTALSEADGDNFVYMVTNTSAKQLKIIQGGPDGTYVDKGDYTSGPTDAGYSTTFNSYAATATTPPNSTLEFQFAVASPSAGQDCTNTNYVFTGPGGDINARYATTSAGIWLGNPGNGYKNPGRCLKYKSFLNTTDYNATPEIQNMIINYAP